VDLTGLTASASKPQRAGESRRKWLIVLAACAGTVALVVLALRAYNEAMLANDVDMLHRQILAAGNADAAYDGADPRFQAFYPREVLLRFFADHPGALDRARLSGREVQWLRASGDLVTLVKVGVEDDPKLAEVVFYCTHVGNNEYRLLGIAPGLTAAVPGNLKPASKSKR
jgi:hypothetical protein